MANTFRRSPLQVVALVVGIVYGTAITIAVLIALVAARFVSDVSTVHDVLVVLGSLVVVGFALLPLAFGVDDTLDPRAFATFGIPTKRLATGLALAALIGVPSLVLTISTLGTVVTWSRDPIITVLALIAGVIAVLTCVLIARVTTSIASYLLSTRRAREFGALIALLAILVGAPVIVIVVTLNWASNGIGTLQNFASWLSWTPLGAAWSVPGAAASGAWGAAILQLLVAAATLGAIWLAWTALVAHMLVTPLREAPARAYEGLGWFGRLPGGPTAVIAARSMTYWGRDARYWTPLVMIPVVPVFVVLALTVAGLPTHYLALLPLPIMCLFLGWTPHNDVAFDNTALWLHVVSGTRGIADRAGRIFPVIVLGIPLIGIGSIVTVAIFGDWTVLPALSALSGAILLIGIGLSSIASALLPYPATKPGDSAFTQPQSTGTSAMLVQAFSFFAILLLSAPIITMILLGLFVSPGWLSVAPWVATVIGFAVLFAGLYGGGKVFDRREPELMAFTTRNP